MRKELTPEEKIIRSNVCAECGHKLGIYADVKADGHLGEPYIACTWDRSHRTPARKYQKPNELVYEIWREEMVTAVGTQKATKLERYYGSTALSEVDLNKIIETVWPKAPKIEQYKALMLCKQYGLNPLRNQVFIIPFGQSWVTVLGIKANRQIAADSGVPYSYLDNTPRLMTEQEQVQIMGEADKANLWAITKLRDADGTTTQGYGNWPKGKAVQGADKGNTPFNMACIRSERQALDRLRPGKMPQDVEVMDETYAPKIEVIDQSTGEIKDETPVDQKPTVEGLKRCKEAVDKAITRAEATEQADLDLKTLEFKNLGEFYAACLQHFKWDRSQTIEHAKKEAPEYNLDIADQRKKAWLVFAETYGVKSA